jgi:hypothetical protein
VLLQGLASSFAVTVALPDRALDLRCGEIERSRARTVRGTRAGDDRFHACTALTVDARVLVQGAGGVPAPVIVSFCFPEPG